MKPRSYVYKETKISNYLFRLHPIYLLNSVSSGLLLCLVCIVHNIMKPKNTLESGSDASLEHI